MKTNSQLQQSLWISSLVLAPLVMAIDQFYWQHGVVTITAGLLAFIDAGLFVFAFQGMFNLLKEKMPNYTIAGFFVAVFACIGVSNFGMEGIYGSLAGVNDVEKLNQFRETLGGTIFIFLFIPGLLFPISLLVLAINLLRTKSISMLSGILLCAGAVCFPLSRIPRIELLAHIDNVLLLISLCMIAWQELNMKVQSPRAVVSV